MPAYNTKIYHRMGRILNRHRWLFVLLLLLGTSTPGVAQEATIADLVVANSKTDLLAFFTIKDAFSPDMRKGVQHGIPVTFTFEFVLERLRDKWLDEEIHTGGFEHTMTYDNLKKVFTVTHGEGTGRRLVTTEIEVAMAHMVEVNGARIVALDEMRRGSLYTLRVKATLAKNTLPLNFHYIIPFSAFWDLKTDWAAVNFRY